MMAYKIPVCSAHNTGNIKGLNEKSIEGKTMISDKGIGGRNTRTVKITFSNLLST
jgi:hypothetical protein